MSSEIPFCPNKENAEQTGKPITLLGSVREGRRQGKLVPIRGESQMGEHRGSYWDKDL
jgi:hypothetical protein